MLFIRDDTFTKKEQVGLKKARFSAKECECLTTNYNLKFNSGIIYANTMGITLI